MKASIPFKLTAAQQRAMHREIERQLAEHMRKYEAEYVALALYAARVEFGFGKKRLERRRTRIRDWLHTGLINSLKEDKRWNGYQSMKSYQIVMINGAYQK